MAEMTNKWPFIVPWTEKDVNEGPGAYTVDTKDHLRYTLLSAGRYCISFFFPTLLTTVDPLNLLKC